MNATNVVETLSGEAGRTFAAAPLLDLIVFLMFIMQLVMAVWLYDLSRIVCKRGKQ